MCSEATPRSRRSARASCDHPERPAQVPLVDGRPAAPARRAARRAAPRPGAPPAAHRLGLAREDVDELQPARVPVLQVLELLDEHDRVGAAVAVDHRAAAAGLLREDGRDDRDDRRDPAARGDERVVARWRRVELRPEAAGGRHHVEQVADPQPVRDVRGERPPGRWRTPTASSPLRRGRADRVRAPHLLAVLLAHDRHVLAGLVREDLGAGRPAPRSAPRSPPASSGRNVARPAGDAARRISAP